jgi:anti-sigma factor RsiW
MMDCEQIEELLSRFVEGDLSREEEALVNEHLPGCEKCRGELALYRELEESLLSMKGDLPSPAAVSGRVIRRLGLERKRPRLALVFNVPVISFLSTAACMLLIYIHSAPITRFFSAIGAGTANGLMAFSKSLPGMILQATGGEMWILATIFALLLALMALAGRLAVMRFAHH